jgi:hypothetical protein
MCSCQIHRRFVLQSWAVVIIPTFCVRPILHRQRLRIVTKTVTKSGFALEFSLQKGYALCAKWAATGFRLWGKPRENRDAYARYRRNDSKLTRFENCCNVPLPSHRFETLSGCSHKEMWAGCIVFLTTPTRSSLSALRSVSLRSLAEKASRVLAASYFLR